MAKIAILHLSDLHIDKKGDIQSINVHKIVDVLNTIKTFSAALIIVSGDIAYSGKREQYEAAYKLFGTIFRMIKSKYANVSVDIWYVPGNHDVDLTIDMGALEIEKIIKTKATESILSQEILKQKDYCDFAKGTRCLYVKNPLCCIKDRSIEGTEIKAFLLNTALFSTLENDKGLHYLPEEVLNVIESATEADINIMVMHHSQHWFHETIVPRLESVLLHKCQIVFYGHEHNIGTRIIKKDGYNVIALAGGELCNRGEWSKSEFYLDVIDTEKKNILINKYRWNLSKMIYECKAEDEYLLENDERTAGFIYDEDFYEYLKKDKFSSIADDVSAYYVFQGVEEVKSYSTVETKVFSLESEFVDEIINTKRIVILGGEDFGKTVLLKRMFKELNNQGFCCLFCDIAEITTISFKKFIKTLFRQNYQDRDGEYDRFEQMTSEKKVIFLDNVQDMDEQQFVELLKWLEGQFEIIVYASKGLIEVDPVERLKQNVELTRYSQYKILPFYSKKRDMLVRNIIYIKEDSTIEEKEELVEKVIGSLKMLRRMYSMNPYFIIQYTIYYCNNFKDSFATDGDIFSKVFESNLVYAIRPYAKGITVDKILVLLDMVAYWCYKNRTTSINQVKISYIIFDYNEEHGDDVDYVDFINICVNAKILQKLSTGATYRFADRNRLAYFVARQIVRLWNDDLDDTDLKELIQYIKYGINASIILFITYLTDNLYLIRSIVDKTIEYTDKWISFDPVEVNIPYLAMMTRNVEMLAPNEKDKQHVEEKEQKQESTEIAEFENSQMIVKDYFDYDTEDSEEELNQIIRSMSLMDIVAKCLPGFEHRMTKNDKEKILKVILDMPGQIFMKWASLIEKERDDLLEYLLNEYRNVYLDPSEWDRVKKEDMLLYLQKESLSMLLELMNIAVNSSVKEHTFKYFARQEYKLVLHKLQYLMVLTKLDKVDNVIDYVHSIDLETGKVVPDYMKRRVLKNYLIRSKKMPMNKIQQLLSEYFPIRRPNSEYRKILISRERNRKKQ